MARPMNPSRDPRPTCWARWWPQAYLARKSRTTRKFTTSFAAATGPPFCAATSKIPQLPPPIQPGTRMIISITALHPAICTWLRRRGMSTRYELLPVDHYLTQFGFMIVLAGALSRQNQRQRLRCGGCLWQHRSTRRS
jgi:hypothetical protein